MCHELPWQCFQQFQCPQEVVCHCSHTWLLRYTFQWQPCGTGPSGLSEAHGEGACVCSFSVLGRVSLKASSQFAVKASEACDSLSDLSNFCMESQKCCLGGQKACILLPGVSADGHYMTICDFTFPKQLPKMIDKSNKQFISTVYHILSCSW